MKFIALNLDFDRLSFDVNSRCPPYEDFKFRYSFITHYYFIVRCTLILQEAASLLLRVT